MDTEEVILKMGFDTHGVSEGAQKVSAIMGQTSEHVAEHFVHAESQGKSFKKLLHEISDVSPLMGNAFRLAMDPIAGLMMVMTSGMKAVVHAFEESDKRMEEMAAHGAKRQREKEEADAKGLEAVEKQKQAEADFESKRDSAWRKESEQIRRQQQLDKAREESGGDESEFLKRKQAIDLEEKARIEAEGYQARIKQAELSSTQETAEQISAKEYLIKAVKELAENEEKANKEALKLESSTSGEALKKVFGIGVSLNIGPGGLSIEDTAAAERKRKQDKALEEAKHFREERESIEATLRETEAQERNRSAQEKEQQNIILSEPNKISQINKELADNEKKQRELARKEKSESVKQEIEESKEKHKHDEIGFLKEKIAIEEKAKVEAESANDKKQALEYEKALRTDNIRLIEAEKEKVMAQSHLDREVAQTRRRRKESEQSPFMPTLDELANSMPWQRDVIDESQRRSDAFSMRMGTAYGQRFSGDAQELERLKDEAKRALFVEGPDSTRFKEDLKKIDSLKKGLTAAGLQTSDDRLESIDKHMADLVDKASKEGLVVQPVNGP